MLAKENRVRAASDFRATMKSGSKASTETIVIYLKRDLGEAQARFGFIVSKAVGNAVVRNRVKRRLRACAAMSLVSSCEPGTYIVRALPKAAASEWETLRNDFERSLVKATERWSRQ